MFTKTNQYGQNNDQTTTLFSIKCNKMLAKNKSVWTQQMIKRVSI